MTVDRPRAGPDEGDVVGALTRFRSAKDLVAMIDAFTRSWNEGSSPSTWVKWADEILAKAVCRPRATGESGELE